jgi:hypothetical protein
MLPGPTYVYECQSCKGLFERRSISSGNTSRAKFRSDGQMSAPMLPTTPLLVACPHCKSSIFWPKAKEVDSYETYDLTGIFDLGEMLPESLALRAEKKAKKQKYQDVLRYEQASPQQIFEFIQGSRFDSSYELPLRLLCWQRSNDERIEDGRIELEFDEQENLQKMLLLVDQSTDSHRLLRAEIFRQLTQFDEARFMLDYDFDEEMAARAEQLMLAIERKDSLPFQFVGRDDEYDYETAWRARRYEPEDPSKFNFAELTPPVFKISNRVWWVKVLGMLSHNWALVERNADGNATVYFFQDTSYGERPAIIDSLEFQSVLQARQALFKNDFKVLRSYPGPWMGSEPKGFIYDNRNERNKIYSNAKFWRD